MMRERTKGAGARQIIFSLMSVFILVLILKNSDVAVEYMSRGMHLAVATVIPSLFPFAVVSELIVRSGVATLAGRLVAPACKRLFGLSGECGSLIVLGAVCGFPTGTRAAVALLDGGRITRGECERVVCLASNPSSAFVISAVGASLFGSRSLGVALFAITLFSTLALGVVGRLFGRGEVELQRAPHRARLEVPSVRTLTDAISSSASAMLNVCAFVIFFSTFVGVLGRVLESLGAPRAVRALLFSAFEISSGASEASGVEPRLFGILLCAFALGFSGLSVHLQVASILSGRGVSLGRYFLSKTAEGILNAMLTYAYLSLFPSALLFESQSVGAIDSTSGKAQLCAVGFFVALFILLAKRKKELLQKAKAL